MRQKLAILIFAADSIICFFEKYIQNVLNNVPMPLRFLMQLEHVRDRLIVDNCILDYMSDVFVNMCIF